MFRVLAARRLCYTRSLATHVRSQKPPDRPAIRHDWSKEEVQEIYQSALMDLIFHAAFVHRRFHDPSKIQLCTLMNIKSMSSFI